MADTYTVTRSGHLPASVDQVRAVIVDFHEWRQWSPWEDLDPELKRTYTGPDSGVGAGYEWSGNRKAGEGRMEITGVQAERVDVALQFVRPFKSSNTVWFELRPAGSGTDVIWTMQGPSTFMTKVMGVFVSMDKLVGKDFEKGLARLRGHFS